MQIDVKPDQEKGRRKNSRVVPRCAARVIKPPPSGHWGHVTGQRLNGLSLTEVFRGDLLRMRSCRELVRMGTEGFVQFLETL